ncbi:MAG: 50S ribosomal protein L25/general stress protein Ctc [Hyphomicrobiaceae bacterium]
MAQANVIKASARAVGGKGTARAVRRTGNVPAVVYGGDDKAADTIQIDANDLFNLIKKGRFLSTVFDIDVSGKTLKAIPRDVQLDPVKDVPLHVDFQRIGSDNRVRVGVPVRFINDALSPGLKRGGVLNVVRHDIEVWCPANAIPQFFEVDLTALAIGRSVHISSVALPDGVKPTIADRDFTIATIAGSGSKDEDETPAVGAGAAPAAADGKAAAAAPAAAAAKAPAGAKAPAAKEAPKGKK